MRLPEQPLGIVDIKSNSLDAAQGVESNRLPAGMLRQADEQLEMQLRIRPLPHMHHAHRQEHSSQIAFRRFLHRLLKMKDRLWEHEQLEISLSACDLFHGLAKYV